MLPATKPVSICIILRNWIVLAFAPLRVNVNIKRITQNNNKKILIKVFDNTVRSTETPPESGASATAEIIKETLSNKGVPVFYLKWDGVKVVEDTVTNIAKEYEASVKEEISIRADIAVIDEMLISSIGAKTTELQKQKAELEAKIAVLENKP